jgi:hypothetical protein
MKYLKLFENMFGPDEPKQINQREWVAKMKSLGRDFFSKTEIQTLVDLMENSGREHMQEEEWENLGWSEKMDNFHMGLTYLSFYLPTYDGSNPNPYGVDITKCKDEWFMVSFYQEDWDGHEPYQGEEGYEEYYECDGFDCLLNLLKKEAKLK